MIGINIISELINKQIENKVKVELLKKGDYDTTLILIHTEEDIENKRIKTNNEIRANIPIEKFVKICQNCFGFDHHENNCKRIKNAQNVHQHFVTKNVQ